MNLQKAFKQLQRALSGQEIHPSTLYQNLIVWYLLARKDYGTFDRSRELESLLFLPQFNTDYLSLAHLDPTSKRILLECYSMLQQYIEQIKQIKERLPAYQTTSLKEMITIIDQIRQIKEHLPAYQTTSLEAMVTILSTKESLAATNKELIIALDWRGYMDEIKASSEHSLEEHPRYIALFNQRLYYKNDNNETIPMDTIKGEQLSTPNHTDKMHLTPHIKMLYRHPSKVDNQRYCDQLDAYFSCFAISYMHKEPQETKKKDTAEWEGFEYNGSFIGDIAL